MSIYLTGISIYFTDVDIPNKLYNLDVDIPNTNEMEGILTCLTGMSTYFMDVDIPYLIYVNIQNKQQIYKTTIQTQVIILPTNEEIKYIDRRQG